MRQKSIFPWRSGAQRHQRYLMWDVWPSHPSLPCLHVEGRGLPRPLLLTAPQSKWANNTRITIISICCQRSFPYLELTRSIPTGKNSGYLGPTMAHLRFAEVSDVAEFCLPVCTYRPERARIAGRIHAGIMAGRSRIWDVSTI